MRQPGLEYGFSPEQKQESHYEILANKETRDRLKERILRFVETVHDRQVDSLVFLDRSARPLSWMFQDVWKGKYSDQKRPDIKYVNIGTSSHVHNGVAELLDNRYSGSRSSMADMQNKIVRSERTDEWFSTKEIPQSWQKSLIEHTEVSEELQTIFKKEFDGKTILIVDEMVARGKTQMAAAGFFALAFPKTKDVFSTGLFYSRQYYEFPVPGDQSVIPWLRELGMSGVLELPDETLLSGAITPENIRRILPIASADAQEKQWMVDQYPDEENAISAARAQERKELYEHPEKLVARAVQLRKELKQLAKEALADQKKT